MSLITQVCRIGDQNNQSGAVAVFAKFRCDGEIVPDEAGEVDRYCLGRHGEDSQGHLLAAIPRVDDTGARIL